jgi:DDE superfamily endonuclease
VEKTTKREEDQDHSLLKAVCGFVPPEQRSRVLPLIFGLTSTPMERWLAFGKRCLFQALSDYKPTFSNALCVKYRHAADVAFACDGAKINIQKPVNHYKQSKYYNGWTHGHYVSCIFVFAPDGTITVCALNAPGCLHDSTVAEYGGVYDKLRSLFQLFVAKTVADSAFSPGVGIFC